MKDILVIILLLLTLPLFFYKLGQTSLTSFDEAWYGEISRNIIISGNLLNLTWNGEPYIEHPPAGFWMIAVAMKMLGEDEFAVRFAPAFLGFLSLIVIYFLGKELFNRIVGFASSIGLASSFWFIFRARSGNLDSILTFFFLLTLLLAVKASKEKKFFMPFSISLIFLLLTKAAVPFTLIPTLIVIFSNSKFKKDLTKWMILVGTVFVSWFLINISRNDLFIKHYFLTGLAGVKQQTDYLYNLRLVKEYLHSGIGKWFWPGIASILIGLILKQKRFLILSVFFLSFFLPFLFSSKGHIWHLIPLHPIMILCFFGLMYVVLEKFIKQKFYINILIICVAIYFSLFQIKIAWNQFINISAFISDEQILSQEAAKFPQQLIIDGDFQQSAVFYSKKIVKQVKRGEYDKLFSQRTPFLLITNQWLLDEAKIPKEKYFILQGDRDKILIKVI